jgi:aminopeptidase N
MSIVSVFLYLVSWLAGGSDGFDSTRPGVDVLHYRFQLTLSDHVNVIEGRASVTVRFTDEPRDFYLDLVSRQEKDVGMLVKSVSVENVPIRYEHSDDRLWIRLEDEPVDSVMTFDIVYSGVPADGLIISQNKFGDRTFFADNWPDRARHWIPTVDHPSDKALVEFIVSAPDHYQVVSNGRLVEEYDWRPGLRITHWSTTQPLPTKIMVIGVARFAVQYLGPIDGVPLQTWVYPQSRTAGFHDFAVAEQAMRYFVNVLGPFPFAKLANVQSTTRYGGMENAGAIFYNENSVSGLHRLESTVAHEVAHQWFGDSASEVDWHDVWLSEGFATYMANLYFEHYYGTARLAQRMAEDRNTVVAYMVANPASTVVDTTITDPNLVLNRNSYDKGSWTLHMLRSIVGDAAFMQILRTYYESYRFDNASTADFRRVAEEVAGRDLAWFFDQWIYRPGMPVLRLSWDYDQDAAMVTVNVRQQQETPFRFPLDIGVSVDAGTTMHTVQVNERHATFRFPATGEPTAVTPDPNVRLLAIFEAR